MTRFVLIMNMFIVSMLLSLTAWLLINTFVIEISFAKCIILEFLFGILGKLYIFISRKARSAYSGTTT